MSGHDGEGWRDADHERDFMERVAAAHEGQTASTDQATAAIMEQVALAKRMVALDERRVSAMETDAVSRARIATALERFVAVLEAK